MARGKTHIQVADLLDDAINRIEPLVPFMTQARPSSGGLRTAALRRGGAGNIRVLRRSRGGLKHVSHRSYRHCGDPDMPLHFRWPSSPTWRPLALGRWRDLGRCGRELLLGPEQLRPKTALLLLGSWA